MYKKPMIKISTQSKKTDVNSGKKKVRKSSTIAAKLCYTTKDSTICFFLQSSANNR